MTEPYANQDVAFACRPGCGACCIAPSIRTPFFGMPHGKAAGERCVHLTADNLCALFGRPERPSFCNEMRAEPWCCGDSTADALARLARIEQQTGP